jgi:hypothetical protein
MNGAIRELAPEQITALVLPLRMRVWHGELGMVWHAVSGPESVRDEFDGDAIHFGYFDGNVLAGSLRLIIRDDARELPTGRYIPPHMRYVGKAAELSKGQVEPRYRGNRCFGDLMDAAYQRAVSERVSQFTGGTKGVVHVGLETLDGEAVEHERFQRIVNTLAKFDPAGKDLRWVYVHLYASYAPPDKPWYSDETIYKFGANKVPNPEPLCHHSSVVSGDDQIENGMHWLREAP